MLIQFAQWGNSIGIRIPAILAKKYNIKPSTKVELREEKGGLFLDVKSLSKADRISEKLSRYAGKVDFEKELEKMRTKGQNVDEEWNNMKPVGEEIW